MRSGDAGADSGILIAFQVALLWQRFAPPRHAPDRARHAEAETALVPGRAAGYGCGHGSHGYCDPNL